MDAGIVNAWVAAIVALLGVVVGAVTATRATREAQRQTELQKQLAKDAAQPYVWATVVFNHIDRPHLGILSNSLNLLVGNSGSTIARNVQVLIDPPITEGTTKHWLTAQDRLRRGIQILAPHITSTWMIGILGDLIKAEGDGGGVVRTVTITADGPFGPLNRMIYTINVCDFAEASDNG